MSTEAIDVHAAPPAEPTQSLAPIAGGKPKSALISFAEKGIALRSMEDAFIFAKAVINSGLAPKSFQSAEAVLVAIQYGAEVGLPPMAALQNIAVINGRPTIWGDAVPGICNATGLVEKLFDEQIGAEGKDDFGFRVTVKRTDRAEPIVRSFTVADAKRAGLWGKQGPWSQYPQRMLLMRSRTFALRDAFPEALRGMHTTEEVRDHPEEKNVTRSLDELEGKATA